MNWTNCGGVSPKTTWCSKWDPPINMYTHLYSYKHIFIYIYINRYIHIYRFYFRPIVMGRPLESLRIGKRVVHVSHHLQVYRELLCCEKCAMCCFSYSTSLLKAPPIPWPQTHGIQCRDSVVVFYHPTCIAGPTMQRQVTSNLQLDMPWEHAWNIITRQQL